MECSHGCLFSQVVDLAFTQLSEDAGGFLASSLFFALFGASRLLILIDKCFTIVYRLPDKFIEVCHVLHLYYSCYHYAWS